MPNEYQLAIRNFQSIESANLAISGLTVIWGPHSSIGKSAVVRALDAMLFGNAPRGIVRDGAKCAAVTLKWDNHSISWVKGDTVNGYVVDGVKFDKVGRAVPEEIPALGFYELEMQDLTVKPQIRKQFDKAWPLILSAPDLGKVVGSLVQTEKVYSAIKNLLADSARVRAKRGQVETLLLSKRREFESFAALDIVGAVISAIDYAPVKEAQDRLAKVEALLVQKAALFEKTERLSSLNKPLPRSERIAPDLQALALLDASIGLKAKVAILRASLASSVPTRWQVGALVNAAAAIAKRRHTPQEIWLDLPDPALYKAITCLLGALSKAVRAAEAFKLSDAHVVAYQNKLEEDGFIVCKECDGQGLLHPEKATINA